MKLEPEGLVASLDPTAVDKLRRFQGILAGRGVALGAISRRDGGRVWERHVVDSLRATLCLEPGDRLVADVGSGGGLPGIPLAVARPDVSVTLIEPRGSRVAFLETALAELALPNVTILQARAEAVTDRFDVCLARALAKPGVTWNILRPLLREGGRIVYFAGGSFGGEDREELVRAGAGAKVCESALFPGFGSLVIMQSGS